jgi:S-DNA-T family DNA segregation ATPase FtsK/SpoIIIE
MQLTVTIRADAGFESDVRVDAPFGTTVAELLPALADLTGTASSRITSNGQPILDSASLGGPGLRSGCVLGVGLGGQRRSPARSVLQLRVTGGPVAGQVVALARGAHIIGRSANADIDLDDPNISREHAQLVVGADGIWLRDLTSTNGTWLDGRAIGDAVTRLTFGRAFKLGSSTLAVVGATEPPAATRIDETGHLLVNRPPRIVESPPHEAVEFPAEIEGISRPRLQWLTALLPSAVATGLALAMRNVDFLAFGLLTPVTVLASHAADRRAWFRTRRSDRAIFAAAEEAARHALEHRLADEAERRSWNYPDAATITQAAEGPDCRLWERRPDQPDFLAVRLGLADQPAQVMAVRAGSPPERPTLTDVPVTVRLRDGALGLAGPLPLVRGTARWLIGQLIALHSPGDLNIIAILGQPAREWRWLRWISASALTIASHADQHRQVVADLMTLIAARQRQHGAEKPDWQGPWTVLLIDPAREAATLPGLRTVLEEGPPVGVTAVCVADDARLLPVSCHALAYVTSEIGALIDVSVLGRPPLRAVVADRVPMAWCDRLARNLAPLVDADRAPSDSLPDSVRLLELLDLDGVTPDLLARRWSSASAPVALIGMSAAGPIEVDLISDGPHVLVAGSTGSGKSELLRSLVAGLAANHAPDALAFVLIDYKGGAAFAECSDLPHTLGLVTDLDAHLTRRALASLNAELRRREAAFAEARVADLDSYRATAWAVGVPLPRLVLVIDEFAFLAEEFPMFLTGLVGIAQRGRSLGVHLVLATQRPAGVVSPEIKTNIALRIALRVTDAAESADVIGSDAASRIPKQVPGRAFAQTASGLVEFQTARIGIPAAAAATVSVRRLDEWNNPIEMDWIAPAGQDDLQLLTDAACEAAHKLGRQLPDRPWLPPLAPLLTVSDLEEVGPADRYLVGFALADYPAQQRQAPVTHDLAEGGSIGFIGGPRSGRTTALRTFLGAAATRLPPDLLHCYVIDCAGGALRPLEQLTHCGAVAARDDFATVATVISRLSEELSRRRRWLAEAGLNTADEARRSGRAMPAMLVAIDGWESLTALSEDYDAGRSADAVLQLLRESASAGFTFLLTGDRAALGARIASCLSRKFLLELVDRADYALAGLSSAQLPTEFGPGRAVSADEGLEVQLALLAADASGAAQSDAIRDVALLHPGRAHQGPPKIRPLPSSVSNAELSTRRRGAAVRADEASTHRVLLGAGGDDAGPIYIDLFAGDRRFLIAGPPRSGRSSAAVTLAAQYLAAGRGLLVVAGHRSPLSTWAARHGVDQVAPRSNSVAAAPVESLAALLGAVTPELIVIDDAEQLSDTGVGAALESALAEHTSAILATARSDDLLVSFRGVATVVRRSRTGLILQPSAQHGELLGVRVPRGLAGGAVGRGLLVTDELRAGAPDGLAIQVIRPEEASQ